MDAGVRTKKPGFIQCYGLFWLRDEVNWWPGPGRRAPYRLLGRIGERPPRLQLCEFGRQRGIYVLHDEYGPYYVGLARDRPIAGRLRAHTRDRHCNNWDRFSWFGFQKVLSRKRPEDGTQMLGEVPERLIADAARTIGDVEALLILALGTHHRGNAIKMRLGSTVGSGHGARNRGLPPFGRASLTISFTELVRTSTRAISITGRSRVTAWQQTHSPPQPGPTSSVLTPILPDPIRSV